MKDRQLSHGVLRKKIIKKTIRSKDIDDRHIIEKRGKLQMIEMNENQVKKRYPHIVKSEDNHHIAETKRPRQTIRIQTNENILKRLVYIKLQITIILSL